MTSVVVGIDVGGSTISLRAESLDNFRVLVDVIEPTGTWRGESFTSKAEYVSSLLARTVGGDISSLAVGAHGCDTAEQCRQLESALSALLPYPVRVVNDAQLLGFAAGYPDAINVVSGTGSIGVGTTPNGEIVFAGGWGWLVGDDSGATGLVREATRAALHARDRGAADPILDSALARAAGEPSVEAVSMTMMLRPAETWARFAVAIFEAEAAGSVIARDVIRSATDSVSSLVESVVRQGARATHVVLGGSVVASQRGYAAQIEQTLTSLFPALTVTVLRDEPVSGAVAMARQLLSVQEVPPLHLRPASSL